MLTPAFELSQDAKFIYVHIRTPYVKVGEFQYRPYQFRFAETLIHYVVELFTKFGS